jgi:hypothetical protein
MPALMARSVVLREVPERVVATSSALLTRLAKHAGEAKELDHRD